MTMRDGAERRNRALQKQIRGSLPHSAGGGRGVGQGWVCCDGVTLESQRGACLQRPSPQPLDHCQHESVTEGWRLEWGG